jgi:serine/threonine protein kinase
VRSILCDFIPHTIDFGRLVQRYGRILEVDTHIDNEQDKEPLIAVKKLISPDESEFEKEVTILKALGSKSHPHPHLIKLLATYRQKQKYHLMFPYANANLRNYWEERPFPDFDDTTVLWSMKQMTGMASALLNIHNFRVTIPLNVAGPGEKRIQKDAELSVRPGEELFGRHGDIKPENILWFEKIPESNDPRGVLQIADFGLGRFHGRDSRSKVNPDTVLTSPTYEPPECKLRRPVSRAYDLWSLGCLYLEFITWLLRGSAEIENFSNFRGRLSSTGIDDDNFFTISRDPVTGPEAAVRDSVIDWVEGLHHHEKCSALMHELLDMIMDQLLIVDSGDRAGAQWLYFQMKALLEKAETDRDYLLRPVPPTQKRNAGGRSKSTSDILGPPKPFARRQISTTDRETIQPLPKFPKPSPDLVGRAAGTPGMKKGKSVTWPVKQMNT